MQTAEQKDQQRWRRLLYRYGITKDDYFALLAEQDGHCALCPALPDPYLVVDHDGTCCPRTKRPRLRNYSCGSCIRGLLCDDCNIVVGFAEVIVSGNRLDAIVGYLIAQRKGPFLTVDSPKRKPYFREKRLTVT